MNEKETPDIKTLAELFYPSSTEIPADLGRFARVAADDLPADYRELLAHDRHMTVTMERFHGSTVDVEVLDRRTDGGRYSRKIRLRTRSRKRIVQFGIMRLQLDSLDPAAREEVLSERTPLGRVLMDRGMLMQVRLIALWRIEPGPDLCRCLEIERPTTIYGRTAMIDFEGEPVIELLEISAPLNEKR